MAGNLITSQQRGAGMHHVRMVLEDRKFWDRLVIAVERDGLIWPKESEIRIEGNTWEALVFDHGVEAGRFKMSLWSVPPTGQAQIRDWLSEARKTQDFNGLQGIPGARWLDAISVDSVR